MPAAPVEGNKRMPLELLERAAGQAIPVHLIERNGLENSGLDVLTIAWAKTNGFSGQSGNSLLVPAIDGSVERVLFGIDKPENSAALDIGSLGKALPEGCWQFVSGPNAPTLAALSLVLGSYVFTRYGKKPGKNVSIVMPQGADADYVRRASEAVFLTRDLVNTPTNDMGPADLEQVVRQLAQRFGAEVTVTSGDELLAANLPMIHAVGRASAEAPRLIDLVWGSPDAPKVTLIGKGVCFDTGGLDIKQASNMLLMKKDMGGAANVIGLASMIMGAGLNVRLRVLIPAVENSISADAFRPGDVLMSRKGLTVEVGNTDAEGRLILADALTLADEEGPQMLIDMATLTGAARVALGPDLAPFYTDHDEFAHQLEEASVEQEDPVWRMPLWRPYEGRLSSKIADTNNVTSDGYAGSIIGALFLKRFVVNTECWVHFDIFAWSPSDRPHGPAGGEAQAIRALERVIARRYG